MQYFKTWCWSNLLLSGAVNSKQNGARCKSLDLARAIFSLSFRLLVDSNPCHLSKSVRIKERFECCSSRTHGPAHNITRSQSVTRQSVSLPPTSALENGENNSCFPPQEIALHKILPENVDATRE